MRRLGTLLAALALSAAGGGTAAAQADPAQEERLKALEAEVARLRSEVEKAAQTKLAASVAPAPAEKPADTKAIDETASGEEAQESERGLDVYGYFDAGFTKIFGLDQKPNETHALKPFLPDKSAFAIGNFNLYLDMHSERHWRFLGEVRFTLAPMGVEPAGVRDPGSEYSRTDTTVQEPGNPENFNLRWSGIVIERAQVEFAPRDYFKIIAGIWLTPYGIWNIDHGSPVVIPARVPFTVRQQIFPERQSGIQVLGSIFPEGLQLGYHLTLSNGRGITGLYQDLDENKAFGGRVFAAVSGDVTAQVGTSWYYGDFTNTEKVFTSVLGVTRADERIINRYGELGVAFDAQLAWKGLDIRGEYIRNRRHYDDRYRPTDTGLCMMASCPLQADLVQWGAYGLISYELPFWKGVRLRPYYLYEDAPQDDTNDSDDVRVQYLGVNWRITPRAVLKGE
jgi:hypothetical protein